MLGPSKDIKQQLYNFWNRPDNTVAEFDTVHMSDEKSKSRLPPFPPFSHFLVPLMQLNELYLMHLFSKNSTSYKKFVSEKCPKIFFPKFFFLLHILEEQLLLHKMV